MPRPALVPALVPALLVLGCAEPTPAADGPDAGMPGPDASMDVTELPPQGHAALTTWLAAGHHRAWACEPAPHPARPPGAHGTNRICSNAALSSATGAYPVNAASVKELYDGAAIIGHAVGRKTAGGWYWYEVINGSVVADSIGAGLCQGCHDDAPRDSVFTQVR